MTSVLVTATALTGFVGFALASPDRPVIGVLTVPLDDGCETMGSHTKVSTMTQRSFKDRGAAACFTAFYAQWIESGGAQVAVIPFDATPEKIDELLGAVDGVLFTGGGLSLELNTTFDKTARRIFNYAKMNRITLWGTCMGFQLLNILAAQDYQVLDRYAFDSEEIALPLDFTENVQLSKMFSSAPASVIDTFRNQNVTMNFHHDGVTPETYTKYEKLSSFFEILSTNRDRKGKEFVSTIEARNKSLSIFGVQWHPERPQFEWSSGENIPHSADSITANSWVAQFLVNTARKTRPKNAVDKSWFIYNHTLIDPTGDSYMWYLFGDNGSQF